MYQIETLRFQTCGKNMQARGVTAWPVVARYNAKFDRIRAHDKNDGIADVAAFAASTDGSAPAIIKVAGRRTRSAASDGIRSYCPRAHRYSILMF